MAALPQAWAQPVPLHWPVEGSPLAGRPVVAGSPAAHFMAAHLTPLDPWQAAIPQAISAADVSASAAFIKPVVILVILLFPLALQAITSSLRWPP